MPPKKRVQYASSSDLNHTNGHQAAEALPRMPHRSRASSNGPLLAWHPDTGHQQDLNSEHSRSNGRHDPEYSSNKHFPNNFSDQHDSDVIRRKGNSPSRSPVAATTSASTGKLLRSEVDSLNKRLQRLNDENNELLEKLSESKRQRDKREHEHQAEKLDLQRQLNEVESSRLDLAKDLSSCQRQLKYYETLDDETNVWRERVVAAERENKTLNHELDGRLQANDAEQKRRQNDLERRLEEARAENNSLREAKERLRGELGESLAEVNALKVRLSDARGSVDDVTRRLSEELDEVHRRHEEERGRLKGELGESVKVRMVLERRTDELADEVLRLTDELVEIERQLSEEQQLTSELRNSYRSKEIHSDKEQVGLVFSSIQKGQRQEENMERTRTELANKEKQLQDALRRLSSAPDDHEMNTQRSKIIELEQKLSRSKQEHADEIDRLKTVLRENEKTLASRNSSVPNLEETHTQLNVNRKLLDIVAKKDGELKSSRNELENCKNELQTVRNAMEAVHRRLVAEDDGKRTYASTGPFCAGQISGTELVKYIEEKDKQLKMALEALEKSKRGLELAEARAANTDITDVTSKIDQHRKDNEKLQEKILKKSEKIKKLRNDLKTSEEALLMHSNKAKSLQDVLNKSVIDLNACRTELETCRHERDICARDLEGCKIDLDIIKRDLETSRSECKKSTRNAEASKSDLDRSKHDLEMCKDHLETCQRDLETSIFDLKTCQNDLEKYKRDFETDSSELKTCKSQLELCQNDLAAMKQDLEKCRVQLKECEEKRLAEASTKEQLQEASDRNVKLERALVRLKLENDDLRGATSAITDDKTSGSMIKRMLIEKESLIVDLQKEIVNLRAVIVRSSAVGMGGGVGSSEEGKVNGSIVQRPQTVDVDILKNKYHDILTSHRKLLDEMTGLRAAAAAAAAVMTSPARTKQGGGGGSTAVGAGSSSKQIGAKGLVHKDAHIELSEAKRKLETSCERIAQLERWLDEIYSDPDIGLGPSMTPRRLKDETAEQRARVGLPELTQSTGGTTNASKNRRQGGGRAGAPGNVADNGQAVVKSKRAWDPSPHV